MQKATTPKEHLDILGVKRLSNGRVVHKLNGRPYNATDGETGLCKVYSTAKYTFQAYSNSPYPNLAKPFCHPMRLHDDDTTHPLLDMQTKEIMESIYESMHKCADPKAEDRINVAIPEFCLRMGEREWMGQASGTFL